LRLLKGIIVEEETLAQDVIRNHLEKISQMELRRNIPTGPEAMGSASNPGRGVIFLDIRRQGHERPAFLRG